MNTLINLVMAVLFIIGGLGALGIALVIILSFLYCGYVILLFTIIDPIYWLFTRKHLPDWIEFKNMPKEDDFF